MAALNRPSTASYEVHETAHADTLDNEDHTFCGIMFPVKAKAVLPVEKIIIHKISVRGQLGNLSVWVSNEDVRASGENGDLYNFRLSPRRWTKIYQKHHEPSPRKYDHLDLSKNPIVLDAGQVRAIYVHSTLPGDEAIVYDNTDPGFPFQHRFRDRRHLINSRQATRYEDNCIAIYSGKAHLCNTAFGQTPIWGWGNAWRDHREFVGQLHYGTVYKLWNPEFHATFGPNFRKAMETMLGLQRRCESPVSMMPDECLYYIFNMCRWDWFDDSNSKMRSVYRARKRKLLEQQRQQQLAQQAQQANNNATQNAGGAMVQEEGSNGEDDMDETLNNDEIMAPVENNDWSFQLVQQQLREQGINIDDDDNDSESDESAWEEANGYRADSSAFTYHDVSSEYESTDDDEDDDDDDDDDDDSAEEEGDEEDEDEDEDEDMTDGRSWFRTDYGRIHVLRALAQNADDSDDADYRPDE